MKKTRFASRFVGVMAALSMAVAMVPAVNVPAAENGAENPEVNVPAAENPTENTTENPSENVKAAGKLAAPTDVKIADFTPKAIDKGQFGLTVSWSKVAGASMYRITVYKSYSEDEYTRNVDYYADGKDTSIDILTWERSDLASYVRVSVTALGETAETDSSESRFSNRLQMPQDVINKRTDCELTYDDNCGYSTWAKGAATVQTGKKGKTVTVQKGPSRKGYKFLCWIDDSGKKYTPGAKYKLSSKKTTFYAVWQAGSKKVKAGTAKTLSAPSKVKLTAKYFKDDSIKYHASWSKVSGAYGYLLYLQDEAEGSGEFKPVLYKPYIVLGENSTSYDFARYTEASSQVLYVRPITKSDYKNFEEFYTGKKYAKSNSIAVNEASLNENYNTYLLLKISPKAIKFTTTDDVKEFLTYGPAGKKLSYWWDSTTRKKVTEGDTFTGSHKIYAIWE